MSSLLNLKVCHKGQYCICIVCVSLFSTVLMGYPALWPTLINEVGPKRRKCKAKKKNCCCTNLESLKNMIVICFGQEKCGDKCRRWSRWELVTYRLHTMPLCLKFSIYINVKISLYIMRLLSCFIHNKTVQKN